ncbi:MAG: pantetheine-phosphate adenylyltransferase [Clostridia bacterium]|nr:pantetheine-phosphate adenylyltransferase [Clostridia bacterium]MBR3460319.1 pantetheine-phosphate adenylyltransferase [Clostridia bacterium]
MSIAVFPGSFDPITVGHVEIVKRAAKIFDRVYVSILENPGKGSEFSVEDRLELINDAIKDIPNAVSDAYAGLLVDYCRRKGANVIVRGIRTGNDVDYEAMLESVNNRIAPEITTVYLISGAEYMHISSSLVRQLMKIGISIDGLVPNADHKLLRRG